MGIPIFIGVDGGGTKSRLQMEDAQGNILAKTTSGMASIRISVKRTWHSIEDAMHEVALQAGLSFGDEKYDFYAGMALSGTEVQLYKQQFLSHPHPFKKILLHSDGYAACLGAHDCQNGGIIIIGTGIVGWQIIDGKAIQTSGWGFPQDDLGAGAWLGLEAARKTARWIDKRDKGSEMLEAIYARFDNDFDTFALWTDQADATQFASLAPIVIEYVDKRDHWALDLIRQSAHEVDTIYQTLNIQAGEYRGKLNFALFGGIAPFVQPWVCEDLQNHLVKRKHDATQGALFMIRKAVEEQGIVI